MAETATVVITNYNYGRFLSQAVESALAQTTSCQVVVVDDGSTDGSGVVLEELVQKHGQRLTVIRNDNGGQASAMNAGWVQVKTSYVLFLDADDRLDPDAVVSVEAAFETNPAAGKCQFRLRWIDADGTTIPGGFPGLGKRLVTGDLRARVASNPDDIPWQPTSGNAFRTTALAEFMPIPEEPYRISADHYLSNVSALVGPVLGLERELGDYRVHGSNADHRSGFDIDRARSILVRTNETRSQLIEHGAAHAVVMPKTVDGFLSLTNIGQRLVSYRMGDGHPFPGDHLAALTRRGIQAALARRDMTIGRRLSAVGWLIAVTAVPRRFVPTLAAKGLTR